MRMSHDSRPVMAQQDQARVGLDVNLFLVRKVHSDGQFELVRPLLGRHSHLGTHTVW
jgi:hypothetical protein